LAFKVKRKGVFLKDLDELKKHLDVLSETKGTSLYLASRIQRFQSAFNLKGGTLQNDVYQHKGNTKYSQNHYQGTYLAGVFLEEIKIHSKFYVVLP
jgi:hypothetical protein